MFLEKDRGPYFLPNKSFGTITISIVFPYKYNEEDFMTVRLINDVINRSMNYKEKQDFKKALIINQIIDLFPIATSVEETSYTKFILTIPNPNILKGVSLENCISLLADYIYNPYIENDGFEKEEVLKYIEIYRKSVEERENLIANYANRRLFEISAPNTKLCSTMTKHIDKLNKITPESLYQFYKENIIKGNPFVFVMGDIDENEINKLIDKYIFKTNEKTIKISKVQNKFLIPKEFQEITEEKDFFQSYIALVYKIKNMTDKDRYTLMVIDRLLNNQESFILFKKMRLEQDLVYTCAATLRNRYGFLALTALIHRDSKDKAIKTMKEVINILKDKEYISPLLEKVKNKERIEMIKDKDRKNIIFNDFVDETLEFFKGSTYNYEQISKVSCDDIAKLVDRFCLDTEYFVKGVKNAK